MTDGQAAGAAAALSPKLRNIIPILRQMAAPVFTPPTLTVFKPPLTVKMKVPQEANDLDVAEFSLCFAIGSLPRFDHICVCYGWVWRVTSLFVAAVHHAVRSVEVFLVAGCP